MSPYRFYLLNMTSSIAGPAAVLTAETDAAALQRAEEMFRLNGAQFTGFELWHGRNRVHRNFKL